MTSQIYITEKIFTKEEATMKIGIYTACKSIYGTREIMNMEPVAFDFVPEKKRALRKGSR